MVELVLKVDQSDPKYIKLEKPSRVYNEKLSKLIEGCKSGYVKVRFEKPHKPRTTGEGSQNNLVWKLISIIACYVGDDSPNFKDTEEGLKERALAHGYPYHINKLTGKIIPESMTKIDTVQCSALIEASYEIIAELGIILPPME